MPEKKESYEARAMSLKRKQLVWVGVAVAVVAVASWRFVAHSANASNRGSDPVKVAAVAVVQRRPIENALTLSGEISPLPASGCSCQRKKQYVMLGFSGGRMIFIGVA